MGQAKGALAARVRSLVMCTRRRCVGFSFRACDVARL